MWTSDLGPRTSAGAMRWLLTAMLLATACKHHSEPAAQTSAPVEIDWDACTKALATPDIGADTLIGTCPVCGDWRPILNWATPQSEGGPKKPEIADAMERCNAWCERSAKTRFLDLLDDARGTDKRKPWKYFADECKASVSAVPDGRFVTAPYFALDRIARAATARGGAAAAALAKVDQPLPAMSISGAGVALPTVTAKTQPAPRVAVTLLGDQIFAGRLPRAHLGASGVTVDFGGEPYPGKAYAPSDLAGALLELGTPPASNGVVQKVITVDVTVLVPREMPAAKLQPIIDAVGDAATLYLAVEDDRVPGWPVPRVLAHAIKSAAIKNVGGAPTIQDLAAALAKS
jgi:hypothetical protein